MRPVLFDIDKGRIAQPGLEVGGRERDLQLAKGGAPDLTGVHAIEATWLLGWLVGRFGHGGGRSRGCGGTREAVARVPQRRVFWWAAPGLFPVRRLPSERPGAVGTRRIAPRRAPLQGDPAPNHRYSHGVSVHACCRTRARSADPASCAPACLTLHLSASYHPPDDDAPSAFGRRARSCASRGRTD